MSSVQQLCLSSASTFYHAIFEELRDHFFPTYYDLESISVILGSLEFLPEDENVYKTYNNSFVIMYSDVTKKFWLLYKQDNYDKVYNVFNSNWKESVKSNNDSLNKITLSLHQIILNMLSYNELFDVFTKEILLGKPRAIKPVVDLPILKNNIEHKQMASEKPSSLKPIFTIPKKTSPLNPIFTIPKKTSPLNPIFTIPEKINVVKQTVYNSPKLFTATRKGEPKHIENTKCVVFDFDCTITTKHWYWFTTDLETYVQKFGAISDELNYREKILNVLKTKITYMLSLNERNWIISTFLGGSERMTYLKDLFKTLVNEKNTLYILSRGNKSHIDTFLNITGLNIYFPTSNVFGCEMKKDLFLKKLINKHERVTYIDDDNSEHLAFLRVVPLVNTFCEESDIHTYTYNETKTYVYIKLNHEGTGMDKEKCAQIIKF